MKKFMVKITHFFTLNYILEFRVITIGNTYFPHKINIVLLKKSKHEKNAYPNDETMVSSKCSIYRKLRYSNIRKTQNPD